MATKFYRFKYVIRADHPSKKSYRLFLIKKLRKLSPMLQKREQAPKCGSNEEEKKIRHYYVWTVMYKRPKNIVSVPWISATK
jgi:hypothetical protein